LNKNYPKVLFSVVTFNEEKRIEECISAIKNLDYPEECIKIVVSDAGSKDKTLEILKKFRVEITNNIYQFAEPGHVLNAKNFDADYFVFVAADNIILGKDWLTSMLKVFIENHEVIISTPLVKISKDDCAISNYLNYDTDPFNSFFYFNGSNPRFFDKKFGMIKKNEFYKIYKNLPLNPPLLALAQCTMIDKKRFIRFERKLSFEDIKKIDDLKAVFDNIEKSGNFSVSIKSYILHKSVKSLGDFYNKFNNRIRFSIKTNMFENREKYFSNMFTLRKYLFLILASLPIYQLIIAVFRFLKDKHLFHFYYPVTSFILAYIIIKNYFLINVVNKKR
jgi:glycosyltransferase involved in cell wall biosynthesis